MDGQSSILPVAARLQPAGVSTEARAAASLTMRVPDDLLDDFAHPGGGRVVLVVGAGCSKEPPTSLGLASEYAGTAHRALITRGIIHAGSCNPDDLSSVADAVWAERGSQHELVELLPKDGFLNALPNEGYFLAAAMLSEHAIIGVLSLNFDLAMSHALAQLDIRDVSVVAGPADFGNLGLVNLVYLHRTALADPEDWVLRTLVLTQGWQGGWQEAVAQRFLTTPVRVFAGLGTPAGVLVETTIKIREMVPAEGARIYQVDVIPKHDSVFAAALRVPDRAYLQAGFGEFMGHVGGHLASAQATRLALTCQALLTANNWPNEDVDGLRTRLGGLGLIGFGRLRARWMLDAKSFLPSHQVDPLLLADLLLVVGFIERHTATQAVLAEDGIVEFRTESRLRACVILASGRGAKTWLRLDAEIRQHQHRWAYRSPRPRYAVVAGSLPRPAAVTPPPDLASDSEPESILLGDAPFDTRMLGIYELRGNPDLLAEILR
jgi:hypothetical protein